MKRRLKFKYTNHRGEDHDYVIEVISVEYLENPIAPLDIGWYLHGRCIERDGNKRKGHPVRSFKLTEIRSLEEF